MLNQPWQLRLAAGEGIRSALAGRWLSTITVLLICWIGAAAGAMDALTVHHLVTQEREFISAGGNVVIAVNKEAGVSALVCDRLAASPGIEASAAITRLAEPATVSAAPGADLAIFAVTAGIWRLLGVAASQNRGAVVPSSIAGRLGLADGEWIRLVAASGTTGADLPRHPVRVTISDADVLGEEYAGILLPMAAQSDTTADACLVTAEPANLVAVKDALPAVLPGKSGQTIALDRLISGRFTADYAAEYQERPLAWAWIAGGSLLGLVWLLLLWTRRSADALYATMGADSASRLVLRGTEWSFLAILGGLWGVALGVVAAVAFGAPFDLAFQYVIRHVGSTLLLATVFVFLGQTRRPRSLLAELKDR